MNISPSPVNVCLFREDLEENWSIHLKPRYREILQEDLGSSATNIPQVCDSASWETTIPHCDDSVGQTEDGHQFFGIPWHSSTWEVASMSPPLETVQTSESLTKEYSESDLMPDSRPRY